MSTHEKKKKCVLFVEDLTPISQKGYRNIEISQ
jgi:hypothetical protein